MRFDEFELDEGNAQLTRTGQVLHLPPKAFAVLVVLIKQPGRLVRKDDLFDAVWGHRFVSDSVLKTAISQLRTVLGDDASNPRYIETMSRLGYRFCGQLEKVETIAINTPSVDATSPCPIIGREQALARLNAARIKANAGKHSLFWIAGDAGVGKTTLLEHFVRVSGASVIAYGQCVEQYGAGEPYLPVLQALGTLARTYEELPALMRANAPSWFVQMPWLASEAERSALTRELAGTSHERMVRELLTLMELFTKDKPLLLVTEDLHWSDHATLRLMNHFARWHGSLNVFWVSSFRLTQIIAEDHPLQALRHELKLHHLCEEVLLDSFSESEVEKYLLNRFPDTVIPEAVVRRLHRHTDGLPLFLASVIDTLVQASDSNSVQCDDWLHDTTLNRLPVPEDLAGTLDRQIEALDPDARVLLEAASTCGSEFRARTLAGILERDLFAVSECLDTLVRRQLWLRHDSMYDLPDGTFDTGYAFRHAIYKHAFYRRLGPAQRVQMHRRVARALIADKEAGVAITPVELAYHFEQGREFLASLIHYVKAAELALSQFAPKEAEELTRHALQLLPQAPDELQRQELELMLLAHLGTACSQLYGISSDEGRQVLERAQVICDNLPQTPQRALLLTSLGWTMYVRGEYNKATALGERVYGLAKEHSNPVLLVSACNLLGMVFATCGEPEKASHLLKEGIATAKMLGDKLPLAAFIIDPSVTMRSVLAVVLVSLGVADSARSEAAVAVADADRMGHSMARSFSRRCAAIVEMRLRNPEGARAFTEALGKIIEATGLIQPVPPYLWMQGWVDAYSGNPQAGLKRILEGYTLQVRMGMMAGRVEALICLIDALLLLGDWDAAADRLAEARGLCDSLGEGSYLPDLEQLALCVNARQARPISG